jgi:hypothetical protein
MVETRKLAAILAADVAGYSRLAAADEERTLDAATRAPASAAVLDAQYKEVRSINFQLTLAPSSLKCVVDAGGRE